MRRSTQLEIGREIVERLTDGSTPMADDLFINDPSIYTDAARHQREFPIFFAERPLVMGASCQIPDPGDHLTDDHTGTPLLIVRGNDGVVRTFANVCSHRGSRIVLDDGGCGARAFTCPYHAWVYGLDGSLRAVPGDGFADLDRDQARLIQFPTVERAGLIWVLPRPAAGADLDLGPAVDELLGPDLQADLDAFGLVDHYHYGTRHLSRRLNWKLTMDTFFESYHFRQLHRNTIAPLIKSDMAPIRRWGDHHLMVGIRHTAEEFLEQPEDEWDVIGQTVLVYLLFPNTIFIMQRDTSSCSGSSRVPLWRTRTSRSPCSFPTTRLGGPTKPRLVDTGMPTSICWWKPPMWRISPTAPRFSGVSSRASSIGSCTAATNR